MEERWQSEDSDLAAQAGRSVVVTGASSGIGLETARTFAAHGATVVLACRDVHAGARAAAAIVADQPAAVAPRVVELDLASLASVRRAAAEIGSALPRIDLLINNAGVMAIPFSLSEDGVELTFATNQLGHFALTGLLLDRLLGTAGSRVVTVSSNAHKRGRALFDDLTSGAGYKPGAAYDRSKLANLLFTFELQRRLSAAGAATIAVAAHPGNARTNLWRTSSGAERALLSPRLRPLTRGLVQDAEQGARPTIRAAADRTVRGGDYFGPDGRFELTGSPVRVEARPAAHDAGAQRRLWELSERLSGVTYPFRPA